MVSTSADCSATTQTVSLISEKDKQHEQSLNFANFNQNFSCLSVGYNDGYKVYNCEPFEQCYTRHDGSFGIVEMLFTSSLLALVGSGEQDAMSPRRLRIVNTKRHTAICELTFPDTILSVKMNRERLVVLLESTIYVYDINNMRLLHTIEIPPNPQGLLALSASSDRNILAYPSPARAGSTITTGIARTGDASAQGNDRTITASKENPGRIVSDSSGTSPSGSQQLRNGDIVIFDCHTLQPISVIEAHRTKLAALALSRDGTLLATASDKGTIIRVFSVEQGVKLYQFRRGSYPTKIYSLAFSDDNRFVVASSATETVHIFRLGEEELANTQQAGRKRRKKNQHAAKKENATSSNSSSASSDDDEVVEDVFEDDGSSSENYDVLEPLPESTSGESGNGKMQPVVDSSRRSVARMLRRTSQTLGRKAAEKMGGYLPPQFSSILEPNRHFASLKVPVSKETMTIVGMGKGDKKNTDSLLHILVVTSDGFFYTFGLDPDRGGDCVLLSQKSLV